MPEQPAPQAVVLAGGLGTRLQPLTLSTPKPLLPLLGVPVLAHVLARLHAAGTTSVVLATGYRSEQFADLPAPAGMHVQVATEDEPLGTGGAIAFAASRLDGDGPLLVLNGDELSDVDLHALLTAHERSGASATLHVREVEDARAYGLVSLDEDGVVTAFTEKPVSDRPVPGLVNAGTYVLDRALLRAAAPGRLSFETELLPRWLAGRQVRTHQQQCYGRDLGTRAGYLRASSDLVQRVVTSPALPARQPGPALAEDSAALDPAAHLSGGCYLGAGARVGAAATVEGSVLLEGATVEAGAVVRGSILGAGSRVEAGAQLEQVVLGEGACIGPGNQLAGCRVWPGVHLPGTSIRIDPLPG